MKEILYKAYITYLTHIFNPSPETFAHFTENELVDFIRKFDNPEFTSIYDHTDYRYYKELRNKIGPNKEMKVSDTDAGFQYSIHLKTYASFLTSKYFRGLVETKDKQPKHKKDSVKIATPLREMTEGEKEHVEYERTHRSKALRQACINKYGYQCQCCGMDFASLYGAELGGSFIEVHHLKMISTYDESRPDNYLENLVPLCSNCHAMIHHGPNGPLTLKELRAAYKGEKIQLKICKED